jgi:hypothetical protein
MERKFQDSEERVSTEAASAQEQRQHLSAYEEELERQAAQLREYQSQLAGCEDELARRASRVQELERQLAEAAQARATSTADRTQLAEWQHQVAAEKQALLQQLDEERRRAQGVERMSSALTKESTSAQRQLEAVETELRSMLPSRSRAFSDQTAVSLVREAISSLKSGFKAEAEALQTRWKQQAALMGAKLDRLSTQLRSSQSKLQVLQRSSVHATDANTWATRYEELRVETQDERRALEEEIHYFQTKAAEADEALAAATRELQTTVKRDDSQRDSYDLKESNRLLFEEVQERRRSAEHARKQYLHAVRENKELLKAIDMYKDAIAGRDKDIDKYKAAVVKYAQQLKRRVEFGEVKQTLLEQLEQTQYMISETYKRWEDSPIVRGPIVPASGRQESYEAAVVQLDEYIGRMQVVTERWGAFMTQAHGLQRRYGDAWKAASRGFDRAKEQPRWVDDVERKCSRLLTEAVRVSEAMRDVVNNIAGVLQKERDEKKRVEKERAVAGDNNASVKRREDPAKWAPLDDGEFFDEHQTQPRSRSASQPQQQSPVKSKARKGSDAPRRSSRPSTPARRSVNALYRSSLSSLGRVGTKVQDLEKEIRNARD